MIIHPINLISLRYAIENAWTRESSFCPKEWSEENPAFGQCAVSTALLYKLLSPRGYNVMTYSCIANDRLHYYCTVETVPFDVTLSQFKAPVKISGIQDCFSIDELLNINWKIDCFKALERRFEEMNPNNCLCSHPTNALI